MNGKRILSLILLMTLLLSSFGGFSVISATENDVPVITDENFIAENEADDLAGLITEDGISVELYSASGVSETGNISWELNNGMLTVSGSGVMEDYTPDTVPWKDDKQNVKFIYISDEITSIGNYAFYDMTNAKSVYIPEGIKAIGKSAFEKCTELKEISLPDSLETIGEAAFKECIKVNYLSIPKGVTEIGDSVFASCSDLKEIEVEDGNSNYVSVDGILFSKDETILIAYPASSKNASYDIPEGVTEIAEYAFDFCSNLTEITFPDSLLKIGAGAFNECSALETVEIPALVTEIAQNAFLYGCTSLKEINVDANNTVYSSLNGVLFDKNKTTLIRFPAMCEAACDDGKYIMPKSIKTIGQEAFVNCQTVEKLYVNSILRKVEMAAFMYCDSLTDLWYEGSEINWKLIEKDVYNEKLDEINIHFVEGEFQKQFNAVVGKAYPIEEFIDFQGDDELRESLIISSSNTDVAVVDNEKMTTISEGETLISIIFINQGETITAATKVIVTKKADADTDGSVTIKEGEPIDLKTALDVPENCKPLLNFVTWVSSNERVATVDGGVVTGIEQGKAVIIATYSKGNVTYSARCDVTVIPVYTKAEFFEFSNGKITKYIGSDRVVKVPDEIDGITVTTIGDSAFQNCYNVSKIILPKTITTIGRYAFRHCTNLSEVSLNEGLTTISSYAFYNCISLYKLTIPSTVTSMGSYLFSGCNRLDTVAFADGTTTISESLRNSLVKNVVIPDTVKTISKNAFSGCSRLQKINIPSSVTSIGAYAFSGCYSLKNIDLSKATNLTSISNYTFYRCWALESVTLPKGVKSIGYMAFCYCYALKSITLPDTVTTVGGYAFVYCRALKQANLGSGLTSLNYGAFYQCSSLESIAIPEGVMTIQPNTFYYCTSLRSVVIPSTVKKIDNYAFYRCESLLKVDMPDSITKLGNVAFGGCSRLSEVTLSENLVSMGYSVFSQCSSLKKITIPDSVTFIDSYAFYCCTSLSEVKLSENITSVPSSAFSYCTSLKQIVIPDNVKMLSWNAFSNCRQLAQVTFGSGVEKIGGYAFYYCHALKNIELPDSVTNIGQYAFSNCINLENIYLSESLEAIETYAFRYCGALKNIEIPDTVITIGSYAFYYCPALASINFGEGVRYINSYAFGYCTKLTGIKIPDSVRSIGNYAFAYCSQLKEVEMGSNVTSMGYNVFYGCPVLSYALDMKNTSYSVSDESNVGYIPLEIKYKFKENVSAKNKKITITLPNTAYIVSGSMKLDGVQFNEYDEEQNNGSTANKKIIIDLENNSGVIKFCIKSSEYKTISTYADISYTGIMGNKVDRIGYLNCSLPEISISSADITNKAEFVVEGVTIPGKYVNFYIDDVLSKKVRANGSGTYKTTVSLNNPENYRDYTIKAEIINNSGETKTAQTTIQYLADTPNLEGLVMYYGKGNYYSEMYDLFNASKPPVIAWGNYWNGSGRGYNYYFTVDVSQRADVDKVYVVSTKNGKKEYLEAKWNASLKKYVTKGHFANDCEYIPNVITVEYTKVIDDVKLGLSEMGKYMNLGSGNLTPSITDFTSTSFSATITVSTFLKSLFGEKIDIGTEITDKDYSDTSVEALCEEKENYYAFPITENDTSCVISFDLTDAENALVYVHNLTDNKQIAYKMSFTTTDEEGNDTKLIISDILDKIDAYAGRMLNLYNLNIDLDKLIEGLGKTTLGESEMLTFTKRAEQLDIKKKMFILTSMVLSASAMNNISAPSEVLDYILKTIRMDIEFFSDLKLLITYKIGTEYKIRWVIDPSGYVYEGVTDNRIEGVTATIYCIANEDLNKNGEEYDLENVDMSKVSVWDAEQYNQSNPVLTDKDGKYNWDVPEGFHWQVKFEKDGYEPAYSEWLPVPPVQNDINIALISNAQPQVENVYLTPEFMVIYFDRYMKPESVENITIGDLEYTLEYDESEKDLDGNVFAKEYVVKFDTALTPGSEYEVSVSGAQSYASVDMIDYSGAVTVSSEKNELSVSEVSTNDKNITAEYFNNTGSVLTFKAICAIYGENDQLIDVRMADVEKLGVAEKVEQPFEFEDEWKKYKIFAWSSVLNVKPIMKNND